MAYAGSRTVNVGMWLLPDDEDAFDLALRMAFPATAWQCGQPGAPGLHPIHLHESLATAMRCGSRGVQAFLHLPIGARPPDGVTLADGVTVPDGPPVAAAFELWRSCRRHELDNTYCDHDPGYRHAAGGAYFDVGWLDVRWFEDEVGADTHQLLLQQARAIRSVLVAATRPARIKNQFGKPLTGYRIGHAALTMVSTTGIRLGRPGTERFTLT
ncbi:hypothetical protein ACTMTJ_20980 [Phytohabitans sp. LJ34]|uniref:hypothetical protein n=1 Tax=Phytohabitans sp. LJ34 TaxID=3452217 RepID=UPI003F8C0ABD